MSTRTKLKPVASQSLQWYPIQLKQMTDDEIKDYHLKKFAEWGKKWEQECKAELDFKVDGSIWRNDKLLSAPPSYFQKEWAIRKMKAPSRAWRSFT